MESSPPVALSWFLLFTSPLAVLWIVSEILRTLSARGTRLRYKWASVEHTLRYVAGLNFLLSTFWDLHFGHDTMTLALDCLSCALWVFLFQKKRVDGEDDDFWKGRGKRLKKRLQQLSGLGRLAPTAS